MEHHANIVPWQILAQEKNLNIRWLPVDSNGELDLSYMDQIIGPRTKVLSITHCSNTLGTINDLKKVIELAHKVGAIVVVDGAQMVANRAVNVQELGADFYAFSGHKLFGPYGIGVLYGRKEWLDKMPPYQGGGSMISQVTCASVSYNDLPFKFEAGTPNIEGVIALKSAIDYVEKIGFEAISEHEETLRHLAFARLSEMPEIQLFGHAKERAPIFSFNMKGVHASDIGQVLDQESIAVRVGHHCTQPLLKKFGLNATVRASFSIFNNEKDLDALMIGLKKAKELFL
jgi:cysteine desulfurase/selenocysteine lyase